MARSGPSALLTFTTTPRDARRTGRSARCSAAQHVRALEAKFALQRGRTCFRIPTLTVVRLSVRQRSLRPVLARERSSRVPVAQRTGFREWKVPAVPFRIAQEIAVAGGVLRGRDIVSMRDAPQRGRTLASARCSRRLAHRVAEGLRRTSYPKRARAPISGPTSRSGLVNACLSSHFHRFCLRDLRLCRITACDRADFERGCVPDRGDRATRG